jgi:hypothetical protein
VPVPVQEVAQDGVLWRSFLKSDRWQDMNRRRQFFDCSQHAHKTWNFDGTKYRKFVSQQPLLTQEVAPFYVPLSDRRPSSPVRLGKAIVDAFTSMVFGEERWPGMLCQGDSDTQDFATALAKAGDFRTKMVELRNFGGASGAAGMSWCFKDGKPRVEVHDARDLYVHEWRDRGECIPASVSEVYLYPVDEFDPEKAKVVRNTYWYRHDWTADREIAYQPTKWRGDQEPVFVVDQEASVEHGFGEAPFLWVKNTPGTLPDGLPDYHEQYDSLDELDIISSVMGRGTILNLDPTLVLNVDPLLVQRAGVRKGSDNSLIVGKDGDAKYLELAGTSSEAGIKVFGTKRRNILEACQCVIPDPDVVAAAGTSSVAIKAIYQPMLGRSSVLRELYGKPLKRMVEQMLAVAREKMAETVQVQVPDDLQDERGSGSGTTQEATQFIDLPPKIVEKPGEDDEGNPTPEVQQTEEDLKPGEGESIELGWGEWFPLTPQDRNQAVQALQLAAGGNAVMSQQSAVEEAAVIFGRNPNEEWSRLQTAQKADQDREADMFKQTGGGIEAQIGGGGKPGKGKTVAFGTPKPNNIGAINKLKADEGKGEPGDDQG